MLRLFIYLELHFYIYVEKIALIADCAEERDFMREICGRYRCSTSSSDSDKCRSFGDDYFWTIFCDVCERSICTDCSDSGYYHIIIIQSVERRIVLYGLP
jgi:hypothetical protein